jgi:hypothetical protein
VWILAAAGRLLGGGGLQPRVARPKSTDSCCFQGVVGVRRLTRQAEFWELQTGFLGGGWSSEIDFEYVMYSYMLSSGFEGGGRTRGLTQRIHSSL